MDRSFRTADHPLTDDEILERYGDLLEEGMRAFRADPLMLVAMAEAAGDLRRKRAAPKPRPKPEPKPKTKRPRVDLSERDAEIHRLIGEGLPAPEVARRVGTSAVAVRSVMSRKRRKDQADTAAMSVRSVLRHRMSVRRPQNGILNGAQRTTWTTMATNVPCLLDAGTTGRPEPSLSQEQQRYLDRSGVLFTLPGADLQPGDRVTLTRGQTGDFLVKPDPAKVSTLHGVSHFEHRVVEVP